MVPLCRFFKRQEIYGYLPIEVKTMIAEKMDVWKRNIRRFYFLFVVCIDTKRENIMFQFAWNSLLRKKVRENVQRAL